MKTLVGALFAMLSLSLAGCASNAAHESRSAEPLGPVDYTLDDNLKRADTAYREARLDDAESIYRGIIQQHPTMDTVWFRLGNIYMRQNQYEASVNAYEQTLHYNPQDSRAWYNLSLVRVKQSLQTLEQAAARLDPKDPGRARIIALHDQLLDRATSGEERGSH